jgi:hypothetical protein
MKGLSFSEPMVKAWMDGRKTVTRRLIKVSSEMELGYTHCMGPTILDVHFYGAADDCIVKPRYFPGETVYIKETWADPQGLRIMAYKADRATAYENVKWKSPRFTPEWAARSKALIVSVRPERIQNITIGEVNNEGFVCDPMLDDVDTVMGRHPFVCLWESLHPGSWDRNDWVWRIELRKSE